MNTFAFFTILVFALMMKKQWWAKMTPSLRTAADFTLFENLMKGSRQQCLKGLSLAPTQLH